MPFHHQALKRIYAPLIRLGDLCFDIGAHLGDRILAWSRLNAHIIALDPHPGVMSWLRHWYSHHRNVLLIEQAVGAQPGAATLWVSRLTPSVSTLSQKWLTTVQHNRKFAGVRWEEQVQVTVTTLDSLIAQYGKPAFCKIDVEGTELEVLQGLSQALAALSFEYIPAMIEIALGCINRLGLLGDYEYNWRVSEWPRWRSPVWISPQVLTTHLTHMSPDSNSGDVYARLKS